MAIYIIPGGSTVAGGLLPFNATLSGYVGGGPTNLDGVGTTLLPVGYVTSFNHTTSGFQVYKLEAISTALSIPGFIPPLDYNVVTNMKVWVLQN